MFTIMQESMAKKHFDPALGKWVKPEPKIFAKIFDRTTPGGRASQMAWQFDILDCVTPQGLEDTYPLIKELSQNPNHVAVRAKCTSLTSTNVIRKKVNFDITNKSCVIALDVDGIEDTSGCDKYDIVGQAKHIISQLHEISEDMFPLDAGFIVHASSSAGIKSGLRLHMLLEADKAVSQGQIKFLFSSINESSRQKFGYDIADLAYYSGVQVHYFADPIFRDGIIDPFAAEGKPRLKLVKGSKISLPESIPDYETTRGEFKEEFNSLLDQISGVRGITTQRLEAALEELEEADDGVYLRIIPKIYHQALEQAIDFNWLEDYLRPSLSEYIAIKDNTRTIEDYFRNGRREALKAFVHNSKRVIPERGNKGIVYHKVETDSQEDDKFIILNRLPPENHITFLKSSLGTGKTTSVVKWLESGKVEGNFLAITNSRSLVASNAKKFNSGQYDKGADMLNFKRGGITRMSTTIHSLHKFRNQVNNIDFVFIDEADSVIYDLLFSPIVKNRIECRNVLADIFYNAKYIILADGDISEETIEAYGSLINFSKEISFYDHHRKMMKGVRAYEFPDESSIWVALETALSEGEKCLLVSDCGPDELNEKAISLRHSTDGCIIKEVHSRSTEDVDIRRILDYTNAELVTQQIDALLCSPSVTSGIDFSYFDSTFVITRSANQTPNLRFQALRRDRGAQSIYYYTDKSTNGFSAGSEQFEITEGWFERNQYYYASRRERECRQFQSTFRFYLLDQGASIEVFSESWGSIESSAKEYAIERINAITCSTPDYSPLRHNDAYEAKLLCARYSEVDNPSQLSLEQVTEYVDSKPHERMSFFHMVWDLFWDSILKCTNLTTFPVLEALERNKKEFFKRTGMNANPKYANMYLRKMGIGKDLDLEKQVKNYRIYCAIEGIQIPPTFMTAEEKASYEEAASDLKVGKDE